MGADVLFDDGEKRIKRIRDADFIRGLMAECGNDMFDADLVTSGKYERLMSKYAKDAIFLGAYLGDAFAGYAAFYCNDFETEIAYLSMLVVKNEFRRRGIAMTLIQCMIRFCRDSSFKAIRLEVDYRNGKAIGMYEKCGWIEEGPASDHSMHMILDIC